MPFVKIRDGSPGISIAYQEEVWRKESQNPDKMDSLQLGYGSVSQIVVHAPQGDVKQCQRGRV